MNSAKASHVAAWTLAAVLLGVNVAGYWFDLYAMFWWFDRVLHGATLFGMTFWLAIVVFAPALDGDRRIRSFLLIASVGIAIGALWEVAEWAFDAIEPADVIKGKYDSILDIVMDTIGASFAAGIAMHYLREPRSQRYEQAGGSSPYGGFPSRSERQFP